MYGKIYPYESVNGTNWYYAPTVSYSNGIYTLQSSGRYSVQKKSSVSGSSLMHYHYTCGSQTEITCSEIKYVFYVSGNFVYYITLSNNQSVNSALSQMFYGSSNTTDSTIKSIVDDWYRRNMIDYTKFLEDTIFCNDRSIVTTSGTGWEQHGPQNVTIVLSGYNRAYQGFSPSLSCKYKNDSFTVYESDKGNGKLIYPIGLLTVDEAMLAGMKGGTATNDYLSKSNFWLATPSHASTSTVRMHRTYGGGLSYDGLTASYHGVRPVISLKSGIVAPKGNGSKENPYVVRYLYTNDIILDNDISKGIVNIDRIDDVEELSEIIFNINPKKIYYFKKINIIDSNNNEIEYQTTDNEYTFIMPDSDVTITPIYEKVKSSVNVEIMNETDDITVSIDDMSQVEYEEEVNFKVTPIKGYKVSDVKIVDTDGNEIEYNTTDKKNYTFTMPASDVTIIPSYERVSNSVSVDDNKNTKEFIIEINDSKAVVYEDTVKFTITPEDGYTIDKIIIKNINDNEITFKKTSNKNEYSFVMPDSDVVITPTYRKLESINVPDTVKNPNTGTGISIIIIFMLVISSITYIIFKRKKNYFMK